MVAIERILCPIDFSDISRHALHYAAAVARWYQATLTALHVLTPPYVPPVLTSPELLRAALPPDLGMQQLRDQLNSWLETIGEGVRKEAIIEQGTATWCILDRAASLPADLIVIGTHGHGAVDRLLLGSVTEKVLRKATCPVMTVPPPADSPRALPFKRLLCAVDFSAPSINAVRHAFSIAKEADARLVLLHVIEWPAADELKEMDAELARYRVLREARARRELDALVSDEERTWCEPVTFIASGRAWQTILHVAEKEHSDLIVMGVHGRNPVDLAFFGSTTNQVVRRAPCPVLTLRQ